MKFDVRYYLVAILFILFDLEIAFLFPWAVALKEIGPAGFWAMMLFLGIWSSASFTSGRRAPWTGNDMSIEGVLKEASSRRASTRDQLVEDRLAVADDLRPGLLRVEMMHAGAARYDIDRFGMLFGRARGRAT
jgi:hypothetical protein